MRAIEPDDASARRVILVRHGEPIVDPALSAAERHARRSGAPVVLVSHGRIVAGYLARAGNHDAWGIWQTLSMPDADLVDLNPRGGVVQVES